MTTTFTPENSALLLIDHQVGTMQLIKNIDVARAKRMSLALAKTASILGLPTVLTSSQEDRLQGPLLPELKAKGKTVLVITHDDRYFHLAERFIKLDFGQIVEDGSGAAHAASLASAYH